MSLNDTATRNDDWVVRIRLGDHWGNAYHWSQERGAQRFMQALGKNVDAVLFPPACKAPAAPLGKGPSRRYRVQLTTCAHEQLNRLSAAERQEIERRLSEIAELARRSPPPPKSILLEAGISPPYLRFRHGDTVVVYDSDQLQESLTVLVVYPLRWDVLSRPRPHAPVSRFSESRPV
jgi:mRNA-degrading endonuclease RelE of RelBE toxin-antitoxin system